MAADSWVITAGDRDALTVTVTIGDVPYTRKVGIPQITAANQAAALVKLRALLVEFRNNILAEKSVPAVVSGAIGYTELF